MAGDNTKQIVYERLSNGLDAYVVPTLSDDVVVATLALSGGSLMGEQRVIMALLESMLPGSTKQHNRHEIRTQLASLGASISFSVSDHHTLVSIASRAEVFGEVLGIVVDVLARPTFPQNEFIEARTRLDTALVNAEEETGVRASIAFAQSVYREGHPHYSETPSVLREQLASIARKDVVRLHAEAISTLGGYIIIAGDVKPTLMRTLASVLEALPSERPLRDPIAHMDRTSQPAVKDVVISLRDKMNVDTVLGIPLAITRDHPDYHALSMGVQILGGSFSSRLFHELRDVRNYTYGAYAGLKGLEDGYPGFLSASAIFPNDVFSPARTAFREVVQLWAERGVTAKELTKRKEELCGRYVVDLASTRGLAAAVHSVVSAGKPITYLDEYPDIIRSIRKHDVDQAIKEHVDYDLAVSAAAGSVDTKGAPLGA
jgi:zinc protease